jgi:hypothetical protein
MTENEVATIIVDACFQIHTSLGPGLLESVYETVLAHELEQRGLRVERQAPSLSRGAAWNSTKASARTLLSKIW